jgi:hypothetical protein
LGYLFCSTITSKKACGQGLGVKPLKSISSTILSFMAVSMTLGYISILNTAGPSQKAS